MLEGLGAGGEGDDRGWDGWMASPTRWVWVWVNSRSWWWTGRPGVHGVAESDTTERLNWTELNTLIYVPKTCWACFIVFKIFFLYRPFFKVFMEFVTILLLFYVSWGHQACRILAPWLGIEPTPPALEGKVLTTGPPGKSGPCTNFKLMNIVLTHSPVERQQWGKEAGAWNRVWRLGFKLYFVSYNFRLVTQKSKSLSPEIKMTTERIFFTTSCKNCVRW